MSRFAHVESGGMPQGSVRARQTEGGGMRPRLAALLVAVAVAIGVTAYLGGVPSPSGHPATPGVGPALEQPTQSGPGLALLRPSPPELVLAGIGRAASVLSTLRRLVTSQLRSPHLGSHVGFAATPLGAPGMTWNPGGTEAVTPASTMKLLTTLTALSVLGPDHRFQTTVRQGSTHRHIVLVGGGDPLLTGHPVTAAGGAAAYPKPATLQQLAARTAERLRRAGVHRVSLGYDDSLFVGPAVNRQWEPNYVPESVVSPVTALWVDEGRAAPGLLARVTNPARVAADRFAALLTRQGVTVDRAVQHEHVPEHSAVLASVESAPLAQIVQHILEDSDNEGAEVLLRQLAIASGRPGSSAAGVEVVRKTLAGLGIDLGHAVLYDGSGLSRHDRLPVEALVDVLETAADPDHPELRTVITSLPVAGFSGSLDYRFVDDAPQGLGMVRAKTGTLTGVHALAGIVSTRDSRVLVFAVVADRVPVPRTLDARAQLDRIAASLAACAC